MVFMILVQFKFCNPSVYLMSQELEGRNEGRKRGKVERKERREEGRMKEEGGEGRRKAGRGGEREGRERRREGGMRERGYNLLLRAPGGTVSTLTSATL